MSQINSKKAEPFVKWVGGKRQLIKELARYVPEKYNKYIEPFLGGGAFLFFLKPEEAIINDINKELINIYLNIRDNTDAFIEEISKIDKAQNEPYKEYYYMMRNNFNEKIKKEEYDVNMAATFLYLNKHCFNGIYRVNKRGEFNVPFNNTAANSFDEENIRRVADFLKNKEIISTDFEEVCDRAEEGDFIFFDSPYAPLKDTSFDSYTKTGFLEKDHIRLAKLFKKLDKKGCFCLLTNHNTELIQNLYEGYHIKEVNVRRFVNSDGENRKGKELIISNYREE